MIVKRRPMTLAMSCRNCLFLLKDTSDDRAWFVPNAKLTPSFRTTLQRASKQTGIKITTKREPEGLYIWRKE